MAVPPSPGVQVPAAADGLSYGVGRSATANRLAELVSACEFSPIRASAQPYGPDPYVILVANSMFSPDNQLLAATLPLVTRMVALFANSMFWPCSHPNFPGSPFVGRSGFP